MSNEQSHQAPKSFIQQLISQGFHRHRPVQTFEDFEIYELDLTSLKLNVQWFIPFIVPRQPSTAEEVGPEQIKQLWHAVSAQFKQHPKLIIFLLQGNAALPKKNPDMEELREKGVVIWDQKVMQAVAGTSDTQARQKLISNKLVEVVGRGAMSPYVSGRPAVGGRFFGRSTQLRQFLPDDSNCTIIGNRRIGKTSLLKEIKERLKLRGYRTAEIYGATVKSTVDFVIQLLNELGEYRKAQQVTKNNFQVTSLPRWVKHIATEDPVAVFVDELDYILEFDAQQQFNLMHTLRAIFETNSQCRIFFAGFRRVMKEKQDMKSPLFNFTKTIELQGFSREETQDMVIKPMSHLGLDVAKTDLPQQIYHMTAGHPEHIQICCAELVGMYEEQNQIPRPGDLISRVLKSTDYKQKVMGAFLSNTNAFEELVCYLLIKEAGGPILNYEFSPARIREMLERYGDKVSHEAKTVDGVISNLSVSGIIVGVPGSDNYRFASPMLASYCSVLNIDKSIQDSLKKVEKNPDLYHTPASAEDLIHKT
jgi:hypothetical protein